MAAAYSTGFSLALYAWADELPHECHDGECLPCPVSRRLYDEFVDPHAKNLADRLRADGQESSARKIDVAFQNLAQQAKEIDDFISSGSFYW